jgi:hyperosmotically inducible protein
MNFRNFSAAAIVIAAVATSACAASGTDRSTGQVVDDSALTAKVKTALIDEPATKARQIDVTTNRGVVELAGAVDSQAAKTKAGTVAQNVAGVREVRNNLTVGVPNRTAGEVIDDTVITARVKSALAANEVTKAYQINVETREGVVQLHGFVDSQNEANQAVQEARAVPGVSSVKSELEVKPKG